MRPVVLSLTLVLVASNLVVDASLSRVLRQAATGEAEQEATTQKSVSPPQQQQSQSQSQASQQPARLYPDLPQQPNFVPPFGSQYPHIAHHHGQTPFVPFGIQMPTSRLNHDQQPAPFGRVLPPPRPMTPAERLQSQSFANGLGRRLLSMVNIGTSNSTAADDSAANDNAQQQQKSPMDALQNSTVLQQLNKGVQSIYGGLSKMYNSTVQEQLNLLQERFKSETQNSTNPWHQRMAEQVPQYFKQMAARVEDAQEHLNKVWQDVTQAAQGNSTVLSRSNINNAQPSSVFMTHFNQWGQQSGEFFNNIARSAWGPPGPPVGPQMMAQQSEAQPTGQQQQNQQPDMIQKLRGFWNSQVQPQIGMVRSQVAQVWRDMTSSGAFSPETIIRSRSMVNNQQQSNNGGKGNDSDLVDDILKLVDTNGGVEYAMIGDKDDEQQPNAANDNNNDRIGVKLSPEMQNRLIATQRELNQLWMGLTNSLQSAINNVRDTLNPPVRGPFMPAGGLNVMASQNTDQSVAPVDPSIKEIDGKVVGLSKLQRDADMVYETVQQQQRETQQRQSFGDRFKNFFNNMNVDQLPDRIGQSFNRFSGVVGDLWNQLPERWDNFMQNMRPQQQQRQQQEMVAKMKSSTTTTTTSTTTESSNPER